MIINMDLDETMDKMDLSEELKIRLGLEAIARNSVYHGVGGRAYDTFAFNMINLANPNIPRQPLVRFYYEKVHYFEKIRDTAARQPRILGGESQ